VACDAVVSGINLPCIISKVIAWSIKRILSRNKKHLEKNYHFAYIIFVSKSLFIPVVHPPLH
jgi:hypothetical protein